MTTYRLTPSERVTVVHRSADLIEVEADYAAGGSMPPAHRHPAQDERFEVLEGRLRVSLDGGTRVLSAGETIDVPRGARHAMCADGDVPARVRWQTRPALRTEQWWAALDALTARHGDRRPPLPALARLLRAHAEEFELALPRALQRPLFALLARAPIR